MTKGTILEIKQPSKSVIMPFALLISLIAISAFAYAADTNDNGDASDAEFNNARSAIAQKLGFKKHTSLDDVYKIRFLSRICG